MVFSFSFYLMGFLAHGVGTAFHVLFPVLYFSFGLFRRLGSEVGLQSLMREKKDMTDMTDMIYG